jgi:hypothetical protein
MRKALLAAGAALALLGGGAHAAVFTHHQSDKRGDFLSGFPQQDRATNGDLDFTDLSVTFDQAGSAFLVSVTLADDIKNQPGAYVIGIDPAERPARALAEHPVRSGSGGAEEWLGRARDAERQPDADGDPGA